MQILVEYFYAFTVIFILILMSFYDIKYRKIKNCFLFGLLLSKSIYILFKWSFIIFFDSLFGFIITLIILIPFYKMELNVGSGDYKLTAITGYSVGLSSLYIAMLGTLICIIVFGVLKKQKNVTVPLAPFVSFGVGISCALTCFK